MFRRWAKEFVFFAIGIDGDRWQESSILEKLGHVVATAIVATFWIVLPVLIIVGLWLES